MITTEVPRSLQSRIMREMLYTKSWFFSRKFDISSVSSSVIIEKNEWAEITVPDDETHALLKYSCKEGVYPSLNHFASMNIALQKSAH